MSLEEKIQYLEEYYSQNMGLWYSTNLAPYNIRELKHKVEDAFNFTFDDWFSMLREIKSYRVISFNVPDKSPIKDGYYYIEAVVKASLVPIFGATGIYYTDIKTLQEDLEHDSKSPEIDYLRLLKDSEAKGEAIIISMTYQSLPKINDPEDKVKNFFVLWPTKIGKFTRINESIKFVICNNDLKDLILKEASEKDSVRTKKRKKEKLC